MRFFYFSIILTIRQLINESSRELSETPEKNPVISIAFHLGTRDFKIHVLFFLFLPFRERRTLVYFFNSQGTCEIF